MERIKLSKDEKAVFRLLWAGVGNCPSTFPSHVFVSCVASLDRMGFACGALASAAVSLALLVACGVM